MSEVKLQLLDGSFKTVPLIRRVEGLTYPERGQVAIYHEGLDQSDVVHLDDVGKILGDIQTVLYDDQYGQYELRVDIGHANVYIVDDDGLYFHGFSSQGADIWGSFNGAKPYATIDQGNTQAGLLQRRREIKAHSAGGEE